MFNFIFDFWKKKEFYEKKIDVSLEDLLKGLIASETQMNFNGFYREISVLPIEFKNDKATGIFSYKKGRIEIPVGFDFRKYYSADYEPITLKKNYEMNNLGRCEDTFYLKLVSTNLQMSIGFKEEDNQEKRDVFRTLQLNYSFAPNKPFILYWTDSERRIIGFYVDDKELCLFNHPSILVGEEIEEKYKQIKNKPLFKNAKIIIPETEEISTSTEFLTEKKQKIQGKLTEEDFKKLNDWANKKNF